MRQERYQYKKQAEKVMDGKYGVVIPILFIIWIVESGLSTMIATNRPKYDPNTFDLITAGNPSLVFIFSVVSFIIGAIFLYATTKMFIETAKDERPVLEDVLTIGFKENAVRSVALQFLIGVFTFLWALLFIIPGIVKTYAYSMSFYLLFRKPELTASEAIEESNQITRGYKSDLFVLDLSYLGWYFIGLFTFGILWLWVYPKHMTARTLYFNDIYDEKYPTKTLIEEE